MKGQVGTVGDGGELGGQAHARTEVADQANLGAENNKINTRHTQYSIRMDP